VTVPSLPPLPPRSATEIVDGAVQLIRPEFGYFLRIAAIGAIPALLQAVITLIAFPAAPLDPAAMLRREYTMLPLSLLTYAFATVQSGAILGAALALLRGQALPTVWEAFLIAFRRFFPLLGANLLLILVAVIVALPVVAVLVFVAAASGTGLAAMLGTGSTGTVLAAAIALVVLLATLIAMLTVFARSAVMTSLVIAETLGPIQAFRRAHYLSAGSYLRLAATYGLVLLIIGVVYFVLAMVALTLRDQQQLVQALLSVLIIPVVPILGAIMLLTYADLRVRREGADLDAALDAMTGLPAAPQT
jgi:hypothetical protein